MLTVLNNSGDQIQLNALFIQPYDRCARSCPGCYVQEHMHDKYEVGPNVWLDLFKTIYQQKDIVTNQVTISLDTLPKNINTDSYKLMSRIFIDACNVFFNNRKKYDKEIHFTIHCMNDWIDYLRIPSYVVKKVTPAMLTFSYLTMKDVNKLQAIKRGNSIKHINYNYLVPYNIKLTNTQKYIEDLIEIGKYVDSIYVLLNKSPIGLDDNVVQLGRSCRMRKDITFIDELMRKAPDWLKRKINIDGCLQDVKKYKKTGFGCSSNVSRFQVWPDGSVTGCPYAYKGGPNKAETHKDILDNIRQAKKFYDFTDKCYLPETYDTVKQKDQNGRKINAQTAS